MARILILEDSDERKALMQRCLIGHEVHFVSRAIEAIQALMSNWDIVSLDHDLGGQEMVESGPGTGYEVAKWLEAHPDRRPPRVIIHSMNPVGAAAMEAVIRYAERRPDWWTPRGLA